MEKPSTAANAQTFVDDIVVAILDGRITVGKYCSWNVDDLLGVESGFIALYVHSLSLTCRLNVGRKEDYMAIVMAWGLKTAGTTSAAN